MNYLTKTLNSQLRLCLLCLWSFFVAGCQQETSPELGNLLLGSPGSEKLQHRLKDLLPEGGAVVNFWASWCEPCREEMPQLNLLADKLKVNNIDVFLVSVDEDRFLFEEYLIKYPQRIGVFLTDSGNSPETLPTTFLVNAEGQVIKKYIGVRDWPDDDIVVDIIQSLENTN